MALAVEKTRAECVAQKVERVQEAEEKSWQASAWWLERNWPDLYGKTARLEVYREETIVHRLDLGTAEAAILARITELEAKETPLLAEKAGADGAEPSSDPPA